MALRLQLWLKNGDNGHHSKLSGKTKYYHCQLSIKFQISQIHRNLQCTSQFCPSGSISGFQCSIDKCGNFYRQKNKSCLVVAEHGRLALTRRGSHKSALERNCVSVGSRKPPCWLFTVKVNDSLQQSVDVDRLEAEKIFHQLLCLTRMRTQRKDLQRTHSDKFAAITWFPVPLSRFSLMATPYSFRLVNELSEMPSVVVKIHLAARQQRAKRAPGQSQHTVLCFAFACQLWTCGLLN